MGEREWREGDGGRKGMEELRQETQKRKASLLPQYTNLAISTPARFPRNAQQACLLCRQDTSEAPPAPRPHLGRDINMIHGANLPTRDQNMNIFPDQRSLLY